MINPYDIESVADTLKQAIDMPVPERMQRMTWLQEHIAEHNIYKWLADIFSELARIRGESHGTAIAPMHASRDGAPVLPRP